MKFGKALSVFTVQVASKVEILNQAIVTYKAQSLVSGQPEIQISDI